MPARVAGGPGEAEKAGESRGRGSRLWGDWGVRRERGEKSGKVEDG